MTLVRIYDPRENVQHVLTGVDSAIETNHGTQIHFEDEHDDYGRSKHFPSFRLVSFGR